MNIKKISVLNKIKKGLIQSEIKDWKEKGNIISFQYRDIVVEMLSNCDNKDEISQIATRKYNNMPDVTTDYCPFWFHETIKSMIDELKNEYISI